MRKTSKPVLPGGIRAVAVAIINQTPDGSVGYDEAANAVSEQWERFEEQGAATGDLERILAFIRWAKWEGFCSEAVLS